MFYWRPPWNISGFFLPWISLDRFDGSTGYHYLYDPRGGSVSSITNEGAKMPKAVQWKNSITIKRGRMCEHTDS